MKALIVITVLLIPCTAFSKEELEKYKLPVLIDNMEEIRGDIKELDRKVTQIDKDALTKSEASRLLESINKLQQQIASIETKLTEVPITRISNLERADEGIRKDVDWLQWAVKGAIGGAATSLIGTAVVLRRRKNGNGNGNGHPEFCAPREKRV
jgi:chromosome segregation ATPase